MSKTKKSLQEEERNIRQRSGTVQPSKCNGAAVKQSGTVQPLTEWNGTAVNRVERYSRQSVTEQSLK